MAARRRRHAVLMMLHLTLAQAWTSLSQARFGVHHSSIANELRGVVDQTYTPQQALGYLWTLPADPLSDRGLGGGIAFAWDPKL